MREKLIELLDEASLKLKELCGGYNDGTGNTVRADHLIANGVTVTDNNVGGKWIPVTERLPEDICPVLVALEGLNKAFHGWYQDEKWWSVGVGSRPFTQKVTHWMPLPEPPRGE